MLIWLTCAGLPLARLTVDRYVTCAGPPPDLVLLVPADSQVLDREYTRRLVARGTAASDVRLLCDPVLRRALVDYRRSREPYPGCFPAARVMSVARASLGLAALVPDAAVPETLLVGFGLPEVLPSEAIALAGRGALNVHHGALPDYRGHFATYWEYVERRPVGGVTVHEMVSRVDAGPVVAEGYVPLEGQSMTSVLVAKRRKAGELVAQAVAERLAGVPAASIGSAQPLPPARRWPTLDELRSARLRR